MDANKYVKIKIYDKQFSHGTALGSGDLKIYPEHFIWTRDDDSDFSDVCFVTESMFRNINSIKEKHKIALILEPRSIDSHAYDIASSKEFQEKFDFILTHNQELIDTNPEKMVFYPFIGCWIELADRMVYKKSKNISIIASQKRITNGHKLRHEVIAKYRSHIEGVFGRGIAGSNGYNQISSKLEALKDYRFHIVIENEISKHWFTEKICDCFVTGTVPVFCGTDTISNFYNKDGIIMFSSLEELENILPQLTEEWYESRLAAIQDNFDRASIHGSLPDNHIFEWFKNTYLCNKA